MGKILATWLVKITLREQDGVEQLDPADDHSAAVPTNEQVATWAADAVVDEIIENGGPALEANATAERTDS